VDFLTVLKKFPVIAAFREIRGLKIRELQHVGIIFVLGGTIFDLPKIVDLASKDKKMVFVDIDLIKGAGKDAVGVRYLAKESRVHGIITTKSHLIGSARKEGLSSIQRIFLLDSESVAGGLTVVDKSKPDAVEILPGLILPKVIDRIRSVTGTPIIAGGLITKEEEIREILASGAVGISTTSPHLFGFGHAGLKARGIIG
jgi:glycerol uptake operon antiterminator